MESVRATIGPALADRYSVERELGAGAMALVFLAHDLKHDRQVAIKVLRPEVASAIGAERFHREIEVVAGLTHPHILSLHDSGEAFGLLYFVMPFVEGESVRQRLKREECIPVAEAIRITQEIADALKFAHEHGVIHRDVKPANIMLSSGHAQLADFGVAHLVEGADETLTGTGITVGTPAYMSPEQVAGAGEIDGRSDLYSLGCVLYEMLTGRPPFRNGGRRAVLLQHMVEEPPDLRSDCQQAPRELAGLVRKALQKDPDHRFASAAEMSDALASVRSDVDITGGAKLRRSLKRQTRRLKMWQRVTIAGAVFLVALGLRAILREDSRPDETALAMEDPRATYVPAPFAGAGGTEQEQAIVRRAADRLAYALNGWQKVDAAMPYELTGPMLNLGIEGESFSRLEDGFAVARLLKKGTLIAMYARVTGDSVDLDSRLYDVASGDLLGASYQTRSALDDIDGLVEPIAKAILDVRGEDFGLMKRESNSQETWQQFEEAREALLRWHLLEAESGFRAAIDLDPDFARAHHYLALTLFWQSARDVERRRALLPKMRRIEGEAARLAAAADLKPWLERQIDGFHSFMEGDYEKARESYKELITADPTDAEAWMFLGVVESADPWLVEGSDPPVPRGDINLALRAFRTSSRIWPGHPISRGLQFDIAEDLAANMLGPMCPMFYVPAAGERVLPYTDRPDLEMKSVFPLVESDTIVWGECTPVFDAQGAAERRTHFAASAVRLYEQSIDALERWALYVPKQSRPHEEGANMALFWLSRMDCRSDSANVHELTFEVLEHLEAAMDVSSDTTPSQRVMATALRFATGLAGAAETARVMDDLVTALDSGKVAAGAAPSSAAANVYLAAGEPHKAIERMHENWVQEYRSAEDPSTESSRFEYGDVFQALGKIRVLGATGVVGAELDAAFGEVNAEWTAPDEPARKRAVLRRASIRDRHPSADIRPALAEDGEAREVWLSAWGDLAPDIEEVWKGLGAAEDQPEDAGGWLDSALVELAARDTLPGRVFSADYFITGLLAQAVGDDRRAADMFRRAQSCPLDLTNLDVTWGLANLSRFYRAQSLERLGRTGEAASEYRRFAEQWADGESAVKARVEAAVRSAARLRSAPMPEVD